jgi:hypothetical protein
MRRERGTGSDPRDDAGTAAMVTPTKMGDCDATIVYL